MSRLTRDGTAEPVSRDHILRHARGQGNIIFPVQLTTSRIGNLTRLIHTLLYVMTIHTYIHTYCVYQPAQSPSVGKFPPGSGSVSYHPVITKALTLNYVHSYHHLFLGINEFFEGDDYTLNTYLLYCTACAMECHRAREALPSIRCYHTTLLIIYVLSSTV